MNKPQGVAVDTAGDVFIADTTNSRVREVTAATGLISTVAGGGSGGDGGPATQASVPGPSDVAVDGSGNLFIYAQYASGGAIREVTAADGIINTIFSSAPYPTGGVAVGPDGSVYVAALIPNRATSKIYKLTTSPPPVTPTSAANFQSQYVGVSTASLSATLTASGSASVTVSSVHLTGANPGDFAISTDQCTGVTVPAGGQCTVSVTFRPTALGQRTAWLSFSDNAPTSPQSTFLFGTGTAYSSLFAGGGGGPGPIGDGGPAAASSLYCATGLATDAAGDVAVSDSGCSTLPSAVRLVSGTTGIVRTLVGDSGLCSDGVPAVSSCLANPGGVAMDPAGDVFIADTGHNRIRLVPASSGTFYGQAMTAAYIYTIAGNGTAGYSGDGGPATAAELNGPQKVAVDGAGDVFIGDTTNNRVRELSVSTGQISTIAGNGTAGYNGDNQAATAAELNKPQGVAVDTAGDVFIADTTNSRVREVTAATGLISTVAGGGNDGDGSPATQASVAPVDVSVDAAGNLFIATGTSSGAVREVTAANGFINTLYSSSNNVGGITLGAAGGIYLAALIPNRATSKIYELTTSPPPVTPTSAANFQSQYVGARTAPLTATLTASGSASVTVSSVHLTGANPGDFAISTDQCTGVTVPAGGQCTVSVTFKPTALGQRTAWLSYSDNAPTSPQSTFLFGTGAAYNSVLAGGGSGSGNGDGGPAPAASLYCTTGVATDAAGDVAIVDTGCTLPSRVRIVSGATGVIRTLAGGGGSCNDGIPAVSSCLIDPGGVAMDPAGDVFIADTGHNRIRLVPASSGTFYGQAMTAAYIYTIAGNGTAGYSGDGGPATAAELNGPQKVALDGAGDVFIGDTTNNRVREVSASTGQISTIAGNGTAGYNGDNQAATAAELNKPQGVAVDTAGDVFIADTTNNRVREVTAATGLISTVAGGGNDGDDSPATQASVAAVDVSVDASGNLFIATGTSSGAVREVTAANGFINTLYSSSYALGGVALGSGGSLYLAALLPNSANVEDLQAGSSHPAWLRAFGWECAGRREEPVHGLSALRREKLR